MTNANTFGPKGWTPDRIADLSSRTYVITGATSGAGFEASRILLSKGGRVVMLNRNADKSASAITQLKSEFGEHAKVSFIRMDLAQLASVRDAAANILKQVPRVDALICNAAIAQVARQELTIDGFESQLGVNHYGHFLLCALLHERIEASAGRIVVVGSNAYKMGLKTIQFDDLNFDNKYTAWNAYAQSKLAQMMFAYELQRRLKAAGKATGVYVCHPGASRTNLLQDTASTFNKVLWSTLAPLIAQSAERGAWPEVMCATEQDLEPIALYGPTKRADTVGPVAACAMDDIALNPELAARLWTTSEQAVAVDWSFA